MGWLLPCLKWFYENHRDIHINVIADDKLNSQIINTADIFFRPIHKIDGVNAKWYIYYHHGLFASKDYLNKMGVPAVPNDLLDHQILSYGEYKFSDFDEINWHIKGKNYGLPKLTPSLSINSTPSLFKASNEGLGICSLPIEANPFYKRNLVRVLPLVDGPAIKSTFAVREDIGSIKKASIALFESFIEDYLRKEGSKLEHIK